ncbi:hypothetical protein [Streptomyces sp. NPDC003483]
MATYYSAAISKDQLHQSQDEVDRAARAQASRVSAWNGNEIEDPAEGPDVLDPMHLHFMNRSPDPISFVTLRFQIVHAVDPDVRNPKFPQLNILLRSVGPCTELSINQENIRYSPEGVIGAWRKLKKSETLVLFSVEFYDRDGVPWVRKKNGEVSHTHGSSSYVLNSQVLHPMPAKDVKECGDV